MMQSVPSPGPRATCVAGAMRSFTVISRIAFSVRPEFGPSNNVLNQIVASSGSTQCPRRKILGKPTGTTIPTKMKIPKSPGGVAVFLTDSSVRSSWRATGDILLLGTTLRTGPRPWKSWLACLCTSGQCARLPLISKPCICGFDPAADYWRLAAGAEVSWSFCIDWAGRRKGLIWIQWRLRLRPPAA